jgi:hypothetical protein
MLIDEITAAAAAAGYELAQGPAKFSGYILIGPDHEKPLGAGFTASLKEVARFLASHCDDVGLEPENAKHQKATAGLPYSEIKRSTSGHPNAEAISDVLYPPDRGNDRQERVKERARRDSVVLGHREGWRRLALMSEAEQEEEFRKAREILALEEKSAALPKSATPLRTHAINWDHPIRQEDARRRRVHHKADQMLKTNLRSLLDVDENRTPSEDDIADYKFATTAPDADQRPSFLAAQAKSGFEVESINSKRESDVSIDERQAAIAKIKIAKLAGEIRDCLDGGDTVRAGAHLVHAKHLIGHGAWLQWLQQLGVTPRQAQRLIALATSQTAKCDKLDTF